VRAKPFGRGVLLVFSGLFLVLPSSTTYGQGIVTGTISGTVQDAQGAVIAGASV